MEQTTTLNAGLDYGLFNNRLTGSVDLYKRTTKDLLLYTQTHLSLVFQIMTIIT
jgi:iron complex outermembrane receptor protein